MRAENTVKFEFNSLEHVLEEHMQSEHVNDVREVQEALEVLKATFGREAHYERVFDIEEKLYGLKVFKNPMKRLLSLAPQGYREAPSTDGKYHLQVHVMHDERRVFYKDLSDCTYLQKAFNDEAELSDIIGSAGVPSEKILLAFKDMQKGSEQYLSQFIMEVEENYSPLVNGVKYVTAPVGAVLGMAGGAVVGGGIALGSVVIAGIEILLGVVGAAITVVGGVALGATSFLHGIYHGSILGAKAGYKLQDKHTKQE